MYFLKPFITAIVGFLALTLGTQSSVQFFGMVLICISCYIVWMRARY